MLKKILHANDDSEGAFKALVTALNLAKRYRAELHMILVEEIQWVPGTREEVISEMDALVADHAAGETDEDRRLRDQPWMICHVPIGQGEGRGVCSNGRFAYIRPKFLGRLGKIG